MGTKIKHLRELTPTLGARILSLLTAVTILLSSHASLAFDKSLLYPFYDADSTECGTDSAPVATKTRLFVIGDSLTYGMTKLGGLFDKLNASDFTVNKTYETRNPTTSAPRITGSSVEATGGIGTAATVPLLAADHAADLTQVNTDAIVIALGTNPEASFATKADALVKAIRTITPAQIYWINTYFNSPDIPIPYTTVNTEIATVAAANEKVTVIDLAAGVAADSSLAPDTVDGVHYSGLGYQKRSEFVVRQLALANKKGPDTATQCCSAGATNVSGDYNQATVFNYFKGKGYTSEQAAGVIGNMIAESGVVPKKLQYIYDKETSSADVESEIARVLPGINEARAKRGEDPINKNSFGFGLVQWTPTSKIIQSAVNAGNSFETIDTIGFQLDFLWGQLSGTGLGGTTSSEKSAGDKMLATTTVEEATITFGRYYERFQDSGNLSNPEYAHRVNEATKVLNNFSSGAVGVSGASCSFSAGANGWDLPKEGDHPMIYYSQIRATSDSNPHDPAVTSFWGDSAYGEGTIATCGCGPTSFAMIVATLKNDANVTPDKVAAWAAGNGYRSGNEACSGSSWWWVGNPVQTAEKWGVKSHQIQLTEAADLLKQGKLIMVSVGPGSALLSKTDNPDAGHLLVMRAVTDDGKYLFADPSDTVSKRANGGDSGNTELFKDLGSSHTPLDAAIVSSGLKGLFVVESI